MIHFSNISINAAASVWMNPCVPHLFSWARPVQLAPEIIITTVVLAEVVLVVGFFDPRGAGGSSSISPPPYRMVEDTSSPTASLPGAPHIRPERGVGVEAEASH